MIAPAPGRGSGPPTQIRTAHDRLSASLEAASLVRNLAAREVLFSQGDRAAAIYKVENGRLRLVRRTVDDHLVSLHTARSGEFFAEAALFSDAYHCDAVAAAPSRVRVYPKPMVIDALRSDPALAEAFMARLASQLQDLRARLELHSIRSARDRVLQYLRLRAGADRSTIAIEGELQDIATEIGMTREVLYRILASLEAEGRLTRAEGAILLTKTAGA
jgi:CRP/FNR family transcriptional regulator, dissimilatory nitrate respiration regulator